MSDYFSPTPSTSSPAPTPKQSMLGGGRLRLIVSFGVIALLTVLRLTLQYGIGFDDSSDYSAAPNSADGAKQMCTEFEDGDHQGAVLQSVSVQQTSDSTWHVTGTYVTAQISTGQSVQFAFECDADFGGNGRPPQAQIYAHPISG